MRVVDEAGDTLVPKERSATKIDLTPSFPKLPKLPNLPLDLKPGHLLRVAVVLPDLCQGEFQMFGFFIFMVVIIIVAIPFIKGIRKNKKNNEDLLFLKESGFNCSSYIYPSDPFVGFDHEKKIMAIVKINQFLYMRLKILLIIAGSGLKETVSG